jgi:adenylate cyclase class 2
MSPIETEVKVRVHDVPGLERRLEAAGFTRQTPRTFERNVLYDTPQRALRNDRQILRIRQYGESWVLTHKAMPPGGDAGLYKRRIETETTIGDGNMVAAIFTALGYAPAFTYEKWRTEWADGEGHLVIDETPIGTYAELEGPEEWIDATAAAVGIDPAQFSNLSYGRLFDLWKEETGSPATDLTFTQIGEPAAIERA